MTTQSFSKMGFRDRVKKATNVLFGNEIMIEKERKSHTTGGSKSKYQSEGSTSDVPINGAMELYNLDSDVKSAINAKVDFILNSGYKILGKNAPSKQVKMLLKTSRYKSKLERKIMINLVLLNNAFVELDRNTEGKVVQLFLIDTDSIEIEYDEFGNVSQYIQISPIDGSRITLSPENVWHISIGGATTKAWADIELKSLYRDINTKNFIEKFINWLAVTNQFRTVIKVEDANQDDIDAAMDDYIASQEDVNLPFILQGNMKVEVLRSFDEAKSFTDIMSYFRHKILMQIGVPPIVVGLIDNSNRSNAEAEMKVFQVRNEAFRRQYMEEFNNELVPLLNLRDVEFKWNSQDKRNEKDDIEIAKALKDMGMKPKKLEEFLRNAGLELPEGELFDKPEVSQLSPEKSNDGKVDGKNSITEDMTQKKTGADSETREDQMVGKERSSFGNYPYTLN